MKNLKKGYFIRNTKNSVFTSLISLLLCVSMLLGTTFAWFTDIVSSDKNVIQSGNLDAQMFYSEDYLAADDAGWKDASNTAVFTHQNWEPGYTDLKYVKIHNDGSLNFKWKLTVEADGPVTDLADVIDVYYVNPANNEITSLSGLESVGTLTEVMSKKTNSTGRLEPGQSAILAIAFHMQESADNSYQDKYLCENGFSLKLIAAQDVGEFDSFGDDYDDKADWDESSKNFTASAPLSNVPIIYGNTVATINIGGTDGKSAVIPSGVKVAEGATSLELAINAVDSNDNLTLDNGATATNMDVHIHGVAADNTQPMIVNLGAILAPGLDTTELKLYHTENGTPVQMTRVASVSDFSIHNQYTYNAETGEVSIYVSTFSVFSAVQTTADEWDGTSDTSWYNENDTEFTLTTAEQFAGFRDLVDGGKTFEGKTVKLDADIDLANKPFDPIGFGYAKDIENDTVFKGTFDGAGHTVYNLYQNCWVLDTDKTNYSTYTYSTAGAGLFASIKDATIKNIAISGAEIVFECVDMGVIVGYAQGTCHFENIVITDSKIANYNRYTGGVVDEVSYGPYGIDTSLGYSHTFKNITVDSTVTVSGLWGSFGCGMGGVIGGKWGDATVKMENVISAPVMDVYNDVVSAYQWYAFRGCGMLIGHTEEPYSDGRHSGNATASFLTCENVKVYYGDWVNYTYYQFANQTDAEGNTLWYSNYPWVRAEAGEYCDAFSNIRYGIPLINGVKVTELSEEDFNAAVTGYTTITFDQLYGADQGMYGQATHEGVTVIKKNVKTIYIHNDGEWANLKLEYWYKNGDDTLTNLSEGIDMNEKLVKDNIYKIEVPIYAYGFKITADNEKEREFVISDVANNGFYTLVNEHEHNFDANGDCICGCKKVLVNIKEYATANDWKNATKYSSITANDDITVTAIGGANTGKIYDGSNWRIYQSDAGSVNIASANGNILSVKIAYNIDNYGTLTLNGNNIDSNTAVDVNDTSVTFGVRNTESATNGIVRITDIEVIYSTVLACDHKQAITETKAPTCTEAGYTATRCAECGKVLNRVEGDPSTGHSNTSVVTKEPTCTETGLKTYTCSKCEASYTENISAKGHSFDEGVVTTEATCSTDGVKTYTCETCGDINTEAISATGHNYVDGKCSVCDAAEPTTSAPTWKLTDLADIKSTDVVIIVWTTSSGTSYAVSNDKGTSAAPTAVVVTISDNQLTSDIADNIKWNISNNRGNLTIYPNGTTSTWLYCTSSNNGVRVGTNTNKVFTIDANSGYLKNTATSRYLGVYTTNPDVRCYTNTTGNTANQTLAFYVYNAGSSGGSDTPDCEHINTTTTTVDATCTEAGSTTVTCDDCGVTVSNEVIEALGHTTDNGVCDNCGQTIGGTTEPGLGEKNYTYTFTASQYSANGTKTLNGVDWTLAGDGGYWGYDGTKGQQFGSGSNPYKSLTLTSSSFENVSKIVINTSGASSVNATFTVTVNGEQVGSSTKITTTATSYTFELDEAITGEIVISYTQTSSKAIYIKSINVTYAE